MVSLVEMLGRYKDFKDHDKEYYQGVINNIKKGTADLAEFGMTGITEVNTYTNTPSDYVTLNIGMNAKTDPIIQGYKQDVEQARQQELAKIEPVLTTPKQEQQKEEAKQPEAVASKEKENPFGNFVDMLQGVELASNIKVADKNPTSIGAPVMNAVGKDISKEPDGGIGSA